MRASSLIPLPRIRLRLPAYSSSTLILAAVGSSSRLMAKRTTACDFGPPASSLRKKEEMLSKPFTASPASGIRPPAARPIPTRSPRNRLEMPSRMSPKTTNPDTRLPASHATLSIRQKPKKSPQVAPTVKSRR